MLRSGRLQEFATEPERDFFTTLYFHNFSTFLGRPGIYLEDLYVLPEARRQGLGLALLKELANICVDRGYERLQWWVLDWNETSIEFYKSIGAVGMDEWTVFRLSGEPLKNLPNL